MGMPVFPATLGAGWPTTLNFITVIILRSFQIEFGPFI